jgi:hypothetical protein
MMAGLLGALVLILLALTAWKYGAARTTLHPSDRLGATVFFTVVGVPVLVCGLALIAHAVFS